MRRWLSSLLVLLPLVSGCGLGPALDRAKHAVDGYFAALGEGAIDRALEAYAGEFFEHMPREAWRAELTRLVDDAGRVRTHELESFTVSHNVGLKAGIYATLVYRVTYERRETQESFRVSAPEDGPARIVAQHVEFRGPPRAPAPSQTTA